MHSDAFSKVGSASLFGSAWPDPNTGISIIIHYDYKGTKGVDGGSG